MFKITTRSRLEEAPLEIPFWNILGVSRVFLVTTDISISEHKDFNAALLLSQTDEVWPFCIYVLLYLIFIFCFFEISGNFLGLVVKHPVCVYILHTNFQLTFDSRDLKNKNSSDDNKMIHKNTRQSDLYWTVIFTYFSQIQYGYLRMPVYRCLCWSDIDCIL